MALQQSLALRHTHKSVYLCLPRSSFSQDSRARARPYFTCWQRPCPVSKLCLLCNCHCQQLILDIRWSNSQHWVRVTVVGCFLGLPQAATTPSLDLTTKNVSRYCKYMGDKITPLRLTVHDSSLCDSHCAEGSCDPMTLVCGFLVDYASRFSFS